jgi:hypothetical protein
MNISIGESSHTATSTKTSSESMPQPNKRQVLRRQLHAATY